MNIKKGDLVLVRDNSGTLKITEEGIKFKHALPGGSLYTPSPVFKVVHIGEKILPALQDWHIYEKKRYNDTIIKNVYSPAKESFLVKQERLIKVNTKEYEDYIANHNKRIEIFEKGENILYSK